MERLAFTISEVARMTGRPARTLRAMCQRGEIGYRGGGRWYITREEAYALAGTCAPPAAPGADAERDTKLRELQRMLLDAQRLVMELQSPAWGS